MGRNTIKALAFFLLVFSFAWIASGVLRTISSEAPDFRILWTFAGHLKQGQNLYLSPDISIPNPYPPFTFLFYLPLTFLPYAGAQAVFVFLIFASMVATVLLSFRLTVARIPFFGFVFALSLVFLSFPAKFSLGMGQQNPIAYFLLLASYYSWKKKSPLFSGILLTLAVSLKPVLGFVAIFFLIQKSWRTFFWALITVSVETAVVFGITRLNLLADWSRQTLSYLTLEGRGIYYNQGFAGFVSRLTQKMPLIKKAVVLFSLSILAAVFKAAGKKKDPNLVFSLLTISVLLIDTLSWQHHFVWLIFPFIVLANEAVKSKKTVLSGLLVAAYLLVGWNFKNPGAFPLILLSNQFYGAIILWGLNYYFLTRKVTS
ncbi:MAG TPA: glycosyltransferase family 87 protein [Patescibacteria group bacterium]|nr:glycosyltransferase family 87 protein [Patescibacteria group bacterium]